jgi:hypothetical protein
MKRLEVPIRYIITTVILLIGGNLAAQSNQLIDTVLAQDHITYGNAVTLLQAADTAQAGSSQKAAPFDYPDDHPLTLGEFSLMVMQTFDIPGGITYSAKPSPRYAARELAFRNIVQSHSYPRMALSGERAMRIIGRVLALEEEGTLQ